VQLGTAAQTEYSASSKKSLNMQDIYHNKHSIIGAQDIGAAEVELAS
jgi:hypothetical protein